MIVPAIAVVDDERRMAEILALLLRREGYQVQAFTRPEEFLAAQQQSHFDLLLSDLKMPRIDGLSLLQRAREQQPELPVILVTAHATLRTAIEAIRQGAFDYIEKPFDNDACRKLVRRALELTRLARENRHLRAELQQQADGGCIAVSPRMRSVLELARRAARSRATVLIQGESGTGKELVARSIHLHSERVGQAFVAVNCKAFAGSLLESELFGHERGAFTGANSERAGVFERAHAGTLFLDEIGEVDEAFQAKLLRVLQEREVLRVGGDRPRAVDVRVVAATNRDLQAEVAAGNFREDLYFRLAVIPLLLPALRERPEDILPLARHFLLRFAAELSRPLEGWSAEVEAHLLRHRWPGNVRELENSLERAAVLARGPRIELEDLLLPGLEASSSDGQDGSLQACLDRAADERIRAALREARGVKLDAARLLGVERTTLYRLMKKFQIDG